MPVVRRRLVTVQLGLKQNERIFDLTRRIEYGYRIGLSLVFTVESRGGYQRVVSEEEFARSRSPREVGIFGRKDPTAAVAAVLKAYPDSTILMRKDPERTRAGRRRMRS